MNNTLYNQQNGGSRLITEHETSFNETVYDLWACPIPRSLIDSKLQLWNQYHFTRCFSPVHIWSIVSCLATIHGKNCSFQVVCKLYTHTKYVLAQKCIQNKITKQKLIYEETATFNEDGELSAKCWNFFSYKLQIKLLN